MYLPDIVCGNHAKTFEAAGMDLRLLCVYIYISKWIYV